MAAKKKNVVMIKKGSGRVKDHRAANNGGSSDSAKVAKLTKASDQRASPSATSPAISSKAHMIRIAPLLSLINRIGVSSLWY